MGSISFITMKPWAVTRNLTYTYTSASGVSFGPGLFYPNYYLTDTSLTLSRDEPEGLPFTEIGDNIVNYLRLTLS